eukprot:1157369-Pelagomonas_calceolata.AAC.2
MPSLVACIKGRSLTSKLVDVTANVVVKRDRSARPKGTGHDWWPGVVVKRDRSARLKGPSHDWWPDGMAHTGKPFLLYHYKVYKDKAFRQEASTGATTRVPFWAGQHWCNHTRAILGRPALRQSHSPALRQPLRPFWLRESKHVGSPAPCPADCDLPRAVQPEVPRCGGGHHMEELQTEKGGGDGLQIGRCTRALSGVCRCKRDFKELNLVGHVWRLRLSGPETA